MIKNIRALVVIAAMVLFPVSVFAEDVPMTEEEICYEEDYAIEAQTEEEVLIVAEEDGFLEEDGLIAAEEDEALEAAEEDFDFVTAFPDEKFRDYLFRKYYYPSLEVITNENYLDISNSEIEDLTGIEYFTNLETLHCNNNLITSLDVSGLKKLRILYFNNCPKLETVNCSGIKLDDLHVQRCPVLDELNCSGNPIKDLKVSSSENLQKIDCSNTQLTEFVINTPSLKELDCSNNPMLKTIEATGNQLTKLNMSGCTAVEVLAVSSSQMIDLDVSGFTSLKSIWCPNCKMKSLDVRGCTALEILCCYRNQLTSLDVSTCTALTELDCYGNNKLKTLDVSFCDPIKDLYESTEPTEVNGHLAYSADSRNLSIDPSVKVLTVHEHAWDGGKVIKKPTTTAEGKKTYTCTIAACGETKMEKIPKLKTTTPAEKITVSKKPTIKKPAATKSKITVKWKHFKHTSKKTKPIWKTIKKVQVQCATDKGFKNIVKDVKIGKSKTKYAIKGLKKKTTYYVRVRYFDGVGYSNWSKVKKVKTK